VLLFQGRIPLPFVGGAALDAVLGVLFVAAFVTTAPQPRQPS